MWENGQGFSRFKKPGRTRSLLFPQLGKDPVRGNRVKRPGIGLASRQEALGIDVGLSNDLPTSARLPRIEFVGVSKIVHRNKIWGIPPTACNIPLIKLWKPLSIDFGNWSEVR